MAIVIDNAASGTASATTLNFSLTISAATDMVLVGAALHGSAGSLTATFDGVAVTMVRQETAGSLKVVVGYILDANLPGAGTFTVSITTTGTVVGTGNAGCAISLEGAKQQAPEVNAGSGGGSSTAISTNITTLTDGTMMVDMVGAQDAGAVTGQTVDGGQTDQANFNTFDVDGGMSTKLDVTAGAESMGWSWTGTAAADAHVIVGVAPADTGPPPFQDIRVQHRTFVGPSTTGSFTVDRIGFQPKACHIWASRVTDETNTNDCTFMNGLCDEALNQAVVLVGAEDGAQNTFRDRHSTTVIRLRSSDGVTLVCVAAVTAFNDDEAVFNFTTVGTAGQNLIFHAVFFGGEDLQSALVIRQAVSASPVTGLAFQPEFVLTQSNNDDTDAVESFATFSIGAFNDNLDEFNFTSYQGNDASNQNMKESLLRSSGFLSQVFVGAISWEASVASITSDGFSWTGTDSDVFDALCFNLSGMETEVTTFTKSLGAAPDTQNLPTTTFESSMYAMHTASNTIETAQGAGSTSMRQTSGAYGRGEQTHVFRTDNNNATVSNQRTHLSRVTANGLTSGNYTVLTESQPILRATPDPAVVIHDPNVAAALIYGIWFFALQRRDDDDPPAMV